MFAGPLGVALAGAVALAGLAATAALALLCFVKVTGLVLLGRPRRQECEQALERPVGMRFAVVSLAGLCVALGVAPGLVLPTLAGLAPGGGGAALTRQPGFVIPGTGSLPTLGVAFALLALTVLLARARNRRQVVAAVAPSWACGQELVPAMEWTSAGFTKPLRLVLEALMRPHRELEVLEGAGMTQRITYASHTPSLVDRVLYEPAVRGGLRGAALARRLQCGSVRTYAAYLLALMVVALVLATTGVLG